MSAEGGAAMLGKNKADPQGNDGAEGAASPDSIQEELSYLRHRISSLVRRGYYRDCFKLIEDNLRFLYQSDRRPEKLHGTLRIHRRCYPSMGLDAPYDDYLAALLKKNGIPAVFVQLLHEEEAEIQWTFEGFRGRVFVCRNMEDYQTALGYCDLLIKLDPLNTNAWCLKGDILEGLARHDDAAGCYEQAVELNNANYQAHHRLAKYYRRNDLKKALEHIQRAIELCPSEAGYQAVKGRILQQAGELQAAVECYEQANMLDQANPEYPYLKAELLLAQDQQIAAIRQYSRSVGLNEKYLPALKRLSELLQDTQPDTALSYVNTVVTLEPENRDALLLRARLQRRLGEGRRAARSFRQLLEADPDCAEAHGALGDLLLEEQPGEALEHYRRASALEPRSAACRMGMARAHERLGQLPEAVREYKSAVSLDKGCAAGWGALGRLHRENPAAAADYYEKAVQLEPENPAYLQARGEALMRLPHARKKEAIDCLVRAAQLDPGNAQLHLQLACLLEKADNFSSAVEHYRFAVTADPELAEGYQGLARLLQATEPDVALLHINRAIFLDSTNGEYFYRKARILSELGLREDALEQLRLSLENDSRNLETLGEISQMLNGESPRLALMYLNRAIELVPQNSDYLCTRGDLLLKLGSKEKALGQYEQVIRLDPQNHRAFFGAGVILAGKKETKKALEYLDRAISLAPGEAACHGEKARLLARGEESRQEALACFDEAFACDRERWEYLLEKADLLLLMGDGLSAGEEYRRVLLLNRDCLRACEQLGILLADANPAAALRYLEHAAQLDPDNPLYRAWMGRLFFCAGEAGRAEEECREAVRLGDGSAAIYFTLAQILSEKLPETALGYYEKAAVLEPQNLQYPLLRGNILFLMGEYTQAREEYEKALSLNPACHEAAAGLAKILFLEQDPACLERIELAISLDPGCAGYRALKADMLLWQEQPRQAIECAEAAVKLEPENLGYREKLIELLRQTKAPLRLFLEQRRYERKRKKLLQRQAALEEPLPAQG